MSLGEIALLGGAGFLAGAVNAVAGGGSLISFPALLAVGQPAVTANVTNAVAVVPGYLGGTIGYRRELQGQRRRAVGLAATSIVGAVCGAILLLVSSEKLFKAIVPFLVLFSAALLAAQPLMSKLTRGPRRGGEHTVRLHAMNFGAAVYGGYFGAGLGIMLLAVLGLSIDDELQRLNALKGLLSLVIGLVAAAYFAIFGPVQWDAAAVMAVTSLGGGQAGVVLARRLDDRVLRWVVVAFGTAVGIALFFT
ncbi:MAG TPA: sulfite exporter TauE/SafE family protein [Thermoleophilaceae bacterium]